MQFHATRTAGMLSFYQTHYGFTSGIHFFFLGLILHIFPQAVCLAACKKLHETGAFTDMLLPDKGSGEDKEKIDQNDEGEPLPGTARHREFYPEGVADILRVSSSTNSEEIFNWYFSSGNIITNLM